MAIFTTPDLITARYNAYFAYIDDIEHTDPSTQTLLQATATEQLAMWRDAETAVANINAAAADNYSNGVGMSVNKVGLQEKKAAADSALEAFVRACLLGGVSIPTTGESSVSYWDMSGASYD